MHVHVVYPAKTDAATAEIDLSKRVLVVEPVPTAILGVVMIGGLGAAVHRSRRRRAKRSGNRNNTNPRSRQEPRHGRSVTSPANRLGRLT